MRRPTARGLTLVELMVSLAVTAILAGLAAPSFTQMIARTRLEGALNGLSIDLQYARSEAVRRRTTARLSVADDGKSYTVCHSACDSDATTLKTVVMPADVTLEASGAIVFDGLRGIAPSQTLGGSSSKTSAQLQVLTNANGRVQMCSPLGSFKGYATC